MSKIAPYLVTLVVFVAIDLVWLGAIAKNFYRDQLGSLMANPINLGPAVAFYLLYPVGIMLFAVIPSQDAGGLARAAMLGGAFGFFAYATYDLTNWATLRGWPGALTYVDIGWGTVLTAIAAVSGAWAASKF